MSTMIDHPDERLIHDFVDDELSGAEHARVEAHLAACPSCRALADSLVRLREDARRVFGASRPVANDQWGDQWGSIEARIERRGRARWLSPLAAAAVVALLIGSGAALHALLGGSLADPLPAPPTVAAAPALEPPPAVAIAAAYRPALAELERVLELERDQLQPETV